VQLDGEQLHQLEFLFDQSARGIHLLFDNDQLARVLKTARNDAEYFSFENISKVQKILSEFVNKQSLWEMRDYLDELDNETLELLIRTYFNIVENTVLESSEYKH
jgi:hypothetical protein